MRITILVTKILYVALGSLVACSFWGLTEGEAKVMLTITTLVALVTTSRLDPNGS